MQRKERKEFSSSCNEEEFRIVVDDQEYFKEMKKIIKRDYFPAEEEEEKEENKMRLEEFQKKYESKGIARFESIVNDGKLSSSTKPNEKPFNLVYIVKENTRFPEIRRKDEDVFENIPFVKSEHEKRE